MYIYISVMFGISVVSNVELRDVILERLRNWKYNVARDFKIVQMLETFTG